MVTPADISSSHLACRIMALASASSVWLLMPRTSCGTVRGDRVDVVAQAAEGRDELAERPLALDVLPGERRQALAQGRRAAGEHAARALPDGALLPRGLLLGDQADDLARCRCAAPASVRRDGRRRPRRRSWPSWRWRGGRRAPASVCGPQHRHVGREHEERVAVVGRPPSSSSAVSAWTGPSSGALATTCDVALAR